MPLSPGTRLGAYEIDVLLGTGGMSEVYRARDSRLERDVALKVLRDPYAADPDWLARFEQEARLLAALNHPHIAQVYGFEEFPAAAASDAVLRILVMEFVEGVTLADRLSNGAVPLDEALAIAEQIADALDAAHECGIVHRDLKPSNIALTAGHVVKVLDFGLAKSVAAIGHGAFSAIGRVSATLASPVTQSGVILGTAAYMAPEQARGHPVDKRADIWAFGVVLYEMLTGRRAFDGDTISDTIAAVLRQQVDWTRLPAETPADVRRLLRRCLERSPRERLHDAGDARLTLVDAQSDDIVAAAPRRSIRTLTLSLLLLLVALAGTALLWTRGTRIATGTPGEALVRFTVEPPPQVTSVSFVAAAANGRFLVYEGQVDGEFRLFMRRFDEVASRPVPGTEGARGPFISPDGAWIAFIRTGKIYKMPTAGGDALPIVNVQGGPGATWMPDGRIVFSRAWLSGLSVVSTDGGAPAVLTTPDPHKQEIGHWWPAALPGGRVLFTIVLASTGLNDARVALLDPATGVYRVLFAGAKPVWLESGHIVFYRAGRYYAAPFDLASSTVTGEPFPVLEDARELDPAGDWSQTVSTTSTGALVYLDGAYVPPSRLTWIEPDGRSTPLAFPPRPFVNVKLSPNGRLAATASLESGRLLLRVFDLERGIEDAPKIEGMNWNPAWLPDGRLSFTSMRKGDFDVYVKDVSIAGAEQAVLSGPDDTDPIAWTRDGRLVFQGSEPDGAYPLKLFDPRRPSQIVRLTEQHVDNGGSLSPDERWLAYQSAASGRSILYVRPLAGTGPATVVTRDPGEFPVFLRDGATLALVRGRHLVVRPWRERDGRFEVGPERVVAQLSFGSGWTYGSPFDVADGGRFLALVRTEPTPPPRIHVVLGWAREVTRLGTPDVAR